MSYGLRRNEFISPFNHYFKNKNKEKVLCKSSKLSREFGLPHTKGHFLTQKLRSSVSGTAVPSSGRSV